MQIIKNIHILTLGAREEVAPTSPPTTRNLMILISLGSNLGGILQFSSSLVEVNQAILAWSPGSRTGWCLRHQLASSCPRWLRSWVSSKKRFSWGVWILTAFWVEFGLGICPGKVVFWSTSPQKLKNLKIGLFVLLLCKLKKVKVLYYWPKPMLNFSAGKAYLQKYTRPTLSMRRKAIPPAIVRYFLACQVDLKSLPRFTNIYS